MGTVANISSEPLSDTSFSAYCDSCWTQKESHEGPDKGSAAQAWQLLMSEKLDNRVYWRPVIQTTQPSSNLSFGPQGKSLITVKMLSSRLLLIILLIKTKSSLKAAKNTKNELILLILLKKTKENAQSHRWQLNFSILITHKIKTERYD